MRQNSKPPQIDTNLLVKSVVNDMTNAEKGAHWLLSSYAPFKDKPCFPGFENRSFEEVRLGYYEATKNGTLEQYVCRKISKFAFNNKYLFVFAETAASNNVTRSRNEDESATKPQ